MAGTPQGTDQINELSPWAFQEPWENQPRAAHGCPWFVHSVKSLSMYYLHMPGTAPALNQTEVSAILSLHFSGEKQTKCRRVC